MAVCRGALYFTQFIFVAFANAMLFLCLRYSAGNQQRLLLSFLIATNIFFVSNIYFIGRVAEKLFCVVQA